MAYNLILFPGQITHFLSSLILLESVLFEGGNLNSGGNWVWENEKEKDGGGMGKYKILHFKYLSVIC